MLTCAAAGGTVATAHAGSACTASTDYENFVYDDGSATTTNSVLANNLHPVHARRRRVRLNAGPDAVQKLGHLRTPR